MSGLNGGNPRELHALENLTQETIAKVTLAPAQRNFPNVVDDSHVASVVVRVPEALSQIAGIAWKTVSAHGRAKRIDGVVNRMGPRVSALHLQTVIHAVSDFGLQTMVDGVELVDLVIGLQQGIIVDGVKRQSTELLPNVEVSAADRRRYGLGADCGTAKGIARIAAVLHQLLN